MTDKSPDELIDFVESIYMGNLGDPANFYASQADEEGLVAVFKAGIKVGFNLREGL